MQRTYRETLARRSANAQTAVQPGGRQRRALRHSPIGLACASALPTRQLASGVTLDKPHTLRRLSLLNR